jgi:hypothetical protein
VAEEVGARLAGVERPRVDIPLGLVAAGRGQLAGLLVELDALGDGLELEAVGEADDRADEGRVL